MTRRYDDGAFIEREPSRRALRDEYRDKFFAEVDGERLKDPFDFDPDPSEQLGVVMGLIKTVHSLHSDEKSAIESVQALVGSAVLGVPSVGLPVPGLGRPSVASVTVSNMAKRHFNRWIALAEPFPDEAD